MRCDNNGTDGRLKTLFFKAGDDSCREDYLMIPGGRDAREEDEARHSHDRLEERPSS